MPGDKRRFQIDYILVKQRFRNQTKDCKSYPGADIDSDHNLVMMKCHLKFKKSAKNALQLEKPKEPKNQQAFQEVVESKIGLDQTEKSVENSWINNKNGLQEAAREVIGRRKCAKKKPWITDEVLGLIEERRKYKNANTEEGQACCKRRGTRFVAKRGKPEKRG